MTRHLVTPALPYANGSIHLGHLLEHVLADVYVRHLRAIGREVLFLCADDTHGTPIEMSARKQGISPEELIARTWVEHTDVLGRFGMSYDGYYSTNTPENRYFAEYIWEHLVAGDHIVRRRVPQMYSESLGRFLPDRMVKGTCPRCGAADQYGDACEKCGATYEPTDLIDPRDIIDGGRPVVRETEELYVRLSDFRDMLRAWLPVGVPQEPVRNFVNTWLEGELRDWCISRNAPYFGFEIPGEPGKYFYVWLDAPIGYVSSTRIWAEANGQDWRTWWGPDADTEITHIIGKDITYFHTLFWPAMLHAAGLRTPSRVHVHGMLTVNGEKMSKSRGTFVNGSTYLDHLDPEYLRYYFASKLTPGVEDLDLNLVEFVDRVNAELVNNVVNFCNRVTKFVTSRFGGVVVDFSGENDALCAVVEAGAAQCREAFSSLDFRAGTRAIAEVGNAVNLYFQTAGPWSVIREDPERAHRICSLGVWAARVLMAMLGPITPSLNARYARCLGLPSVGWADASRTWTGGAIQEPERLLERVTNEQVQAMVEASKPREAVVENPDVVEVGTFKDEISIEEFGKVDLRVGVVESANSVEGADKLIQLVVHCGRRINVFAGVRSAYPDPSVLVGRRVLVIANLKPRKMKFGMSEGMLLATSAEDGSGLQLVHPSEDSKGGWTVR